MAEIERKSNFELLRIFAILSIIIFHFAGEVYFLDDFPGATLNYAFLRSLRFTGWFGNYMFMMLSSWFLVDSKFSRKRIFKIWFEVLFYCVLISGIFFFFKIPMQAPIQVPGTGELVFKQIFISKSEILMGFLPVFFFRAWYPVIYMIFLLFVPFLNILTGNMNEKQHRTLAIILTAYPFVVLALPKCMLPEVSLLYRFITVHFIASYIKIYSPKIFSSKKWNCLIGFGLFVSFLLWNAGLTFAAGKISFIEKHLSQLSDLWTGRNHLPMLVCVIYVFCAFRDFDIPVNKFVNLCAGCTLSAFLIPCHPAILTGILIFILPGWFESPFMIPLLILSAPAAYAICVVIDLLRKKLIEKPALIIFDKICASLTKKAN